MKTLVILSHPYEKSYSAALAKAVVDGSVASGKEVDFLYLDKEGFNPVMTGKELLAWRSGQAVDPKVFEYQNRIKQADHLVFVFPIWWEVMPALLKGFIDKVFIKDFAYVQIPGKLRWETRLPQMRQVTMLTCMSTPPLLYRLIFGNAIHRALFRGTFMKIGVKKRKWFKFHISPKISDEKRQLWLKNVESYFANLK